jgi:xanthine dehydrogenase accessory factor
VLPRARLVVIGASPVARGLVRLAPCVGFAVTVVAPGAADEGFEGADRVVADDAVDAVLPHVAPGAWIVVATQGRRDVQGLRLALALGARQVSFVASARKAQVLKASLVAAGADESAVAAIVAPAGTPMGATTPEEIALSVLAAVVADRRRAGAGGVVPGAAPACCGGGGEAAGMPESGRRPDPESAAHASSCCGH